MGLSNYNNEKVELINTIQNEVNLIVKKIVYDHIDIKAILLDIDTGLRGLGGVKTPFDVNKLPSAKEEKTIQIESNNIETEEERLKRHQEFFNQLKGAFSNK